MSMSMGDITYIKELSTCRHLHTQQLLNKSLFIYACLSPVVSFPGFLA